jgi:hypothetical protein
MAGGHLGPGHLDERSAGEVVYPEIAVGSVGSQGVLLEIDPPASCLLSGSVCR